MKLLVALDKKSIIKEGTWIIISGNCMKYFLSKEEIHKLEEDKFIYEMWEKFDGMMDWGDYDFFNADKCKELVKWVEDKIKNTKDSILLSFYSVLKEFAILAVKHDTVLGFDF